MARMGEGDKRWIVHDRPDGTNVHNWHWAEKDCLQWSKNRLKELLENLTVLDEGGLSIKIQAVEKVEGEAYVNIRKGKVIPGYEISATVTWTGQERNETGNSLGTAEGTLHFPYIADENAGEDPEIRVSVKDDGPLAEKLRQAFVARGKPVVLAQVKKYVEHMTAGGPAKDELESKLLQSKPSSASTPASAPASVPASTAVPTKPTKKAPAVREGFKTICITEKFHCRPRDIYDVLMDENRWKGFTQSNAQISREVGGTFSLFDGAVTGVHQDLQQDKLIVQKWRFGNWAEGLYSTVSITFEEPEVGITVVKLTQTDVPEEDSFGNATVVENTERGWRELIFHKIRAVFGYGI
uniref:Activator of Hsp90 ATPase AHSA1-like N-terminal domain-containing protein n=1 Tax=Araucaria cunninghamii TaxID=56994 RepID=A0A0D6R4J1_ARACU